MEKQKMKSSHGQSERVSDVYLDYACRLTVRKANAKNKNRSHASARLRQKEND